MLIVRIFLKLKVCNVFSLQSAHCGDSDEYTIYHFQYTQETHLKIIPNLQLWDFSKGLKNEFETAVAHEPSVFEPLKVYYISSVLQPTFRPNNI